MLLIMKSIHLELDILKFDYLIEKIKTTDNLENIITYFDNDYVVMELYNKNRDTTHKMCEYYDYSNHVDTNLYFDDILLIKDCDLFKIRQVDCVPVEYCLQDENWEDYYQDMKVKRVAIEFKDINSTKVYVNRHIIEYDGYNVTEEYIWDNTTINHDKVTDFLYERY